MSDIVNALAQTLADTIEGLTVTFDDGDGNSHTTPMKAYKWAPRDLDLVYGAAAGVVEMPTVQRTDPEDPEPQLGIQEWIVEFPVVFYIAVDEARYAQAQAVQVVEEWINAVDNDPFTGDTTVQDCTIVSAGPPEIDSDTARPLIVYPTVVQVGVFVV